MANHGLRNLLGNNVYLGISASPLKGADEDFVFVCMSGEEDMLDRRIQLLQKSNAFSAHHVDESACHSLNLGNANL